MFVEAAVATANANKEIANVNLWQVPEEYGAMVILRRRRCDDDAVQFAGCDTKGRCPREFPRKIDQVAKYRPILGAQINIGQLSDRIINCAEGRQAKAKAKAKLAS